MGMISKLFLLAVFVFATYAWLVLFDHGVSGYKEGFKTEYLRFMPAEEGSEPGKPAPAAKKVKK